MGMADHTIQQIESRGIGRVDTLFALAAACDVPPWYVIALAIDLDPESLNPDAAEWESTEERELLESYRRAPPALRRVLLATAHAASQQAQG